MLSRQKNKKKKKKEKKLKKKQIIKTFNTYNKEMVVTVKHEMTLEIPEGINFTTKSRKVVVKGPRGTLKRDFSHLPLNLAKIGNTVRVQCWFGTRKARASVRTLISHINNMFVGVTKGYRYKMRLVYAHFPISVNVEEEGKLLEIRNFLGEKIVRRVNTRGPDTVFINSKSEKETIYVEGNDLENHNLQLMFNKYVKLEIKIFVNF